MTRRHPSSIRWQHRAALVGLALALAIAPATAAHGRSWKPLPPRQGWVLGTAPVVTATSWILYDATADWVMGSSAANARRPPASTTKMMTALVAVEHSDLNELVTVSQNAADVGEAEIGLVPGEQVPLGELLKAALVRSANDAAVAVAEHVGGTVEAFAQMMNQKAAEMGLTNSSFKNPHGLDEPDHYSSAADLLEIEKQLLSHPELADMVRSEEVAIPPAPDGTLREAETTNLLLEEYQGAVGVKTGFTLRAGLVLAAAAERGERRLLVVVMGSVGERAHFNDATALLDYGFTSARMLPMVKGYGYTVGDGTIDPVAAAARVEAMAWLAASGVLVPPPPQRAPEPVVFEREAEVVADWREALFWGERYWAWLVGDR